MDLVKKTIELDQEAITRIKTALNAKSEKEAINFVSCASSIRTFSWLKSH